MFQQYLAEEVAEDHVDGIINRREALRRLALLGLAPAAASALLAACGADDDSGDGDAGGQPASSGPSAPSGDTGTEAITFPGADGQDLRGAWAAAATPKGAVLVIHENKGLNDHIRSVAARLAGDGYSALAIDLLSEGGGTEQFDDPAQATAQLNTMSDDQFAGLLKSGVDELERRGQGHKLGAMGFCFGGGMTWLLLLSGEPRLSAAVPFYGPLPDGQDFTGSPNAAVLGIYAGQDDRVNASRDTAETALRDAGLVHQFTTYDDADHAFFNDTGPRYNKKDAEDAYHKVLAWYGRYLG